MEAAAVPQLKRVTCFPMQEGEARGFCTKMTLAKQGSKQVGADLVEAWLAHMMELTFGSGLQVREKEYEYPSHLLVDEPVVAKLTLVRERKVPRQPFHFLWFQVEVTTKGLPVLVGEATVAAPGS